MSEWWNGRHARLRIWWLSRRGSSPLSDTIKDGSMRFSLDTIEAAEELKNALVYFLDSFIHDMEFLNEEEEYEEE